ncbi:MAG: hypothetical protein K2N38_00190 [Oscillospiraceae bacterium]|nr:hypothetical protein [Oscillospiraceae bacterium]
MRRNESTTTAVATATKPTMYELNERYKDSPVRTNEYEIDGKKFIVHSHFIGSKDIDKVISEIAFNRALNESLNTTKKAA